MNHSTPLAKLVFTIACCCLLVTVVSGQANLEKSLIKLNVLAPGASAEFALTESSSVHLEGGFTVSGFTTGTFYNDVDAQLFAAAGWRKYYNLGARQSKGKNTAGNSGSYFGVKAFYYGKDVDDENEDNSNIFFPAAVWGLQRTYNSGWNIGVELGAGYRFEKNQDDTFGPLLSFRLGYRIK